MPWILAKLAIRLVAFTAVFWLATRPRKTDRTTKEGRPELKPARISIQPKWAIPLVGLLFAGMNVLLYWLVSPLLDLATLRTFTVVMPLVVNSLLLWGTARIVQNRKWMKVDGFMAAAWLAVALTLAHGVLWVGLEYLPGRA
jgi:uncharacterized membrane protein YvlD (DUF360 family)